MQMTPSLDFIPPKPIELWAFASMLQKSWRNLASLIVNGHIGFGNGTNHDNVDGVWANVVAPVAPNTDFTITHNLGRVPVGYWVMQKDRAVDVYTGSVAATSSQITLRATVASAVLRLFIIGLLFALLGVKAQAQTTVNLTVQDTSSTLWNGPWNVNILPPSGIVPPPVPVLIFGGGSLAAQSGTLSSGTASISLPANANIAPAGTHWLFNVCFSSTGPCFTQLVIVSLSSPMTLTITPPPPTATSNTGGNGITFVATIAGLNCTPGVTGPVELNVSPFTIYYCSATNTWTALGSSAGATVQTNGVNNTTQNAVNFITSTVNAAGLAATPSNPGTSQEKIELNGTLAHASLPALVSGDIPNNAANTSGTAANVTGIVAAPNGGTGIASPTAHGVAIAEGASNFNFACTSALTGQLVQTNNAADPTCLSPGVKGTDVNAATYTVQCDSATTLIDRATTIRFITTTPTVTMPDPTASGCGGNFPVTLIASGVTATVNRTTTAVFNIYNGSTVTAGATTFNLTTGQYATLTSPDNANWLVRIVSGGGSSTPCTTTALSAQYNNAGAFGCISNFTWTAATGVHNFSQLANSNDLFIFKRFTDTSPTGTFHKYQNAAGGALGQFDVSANWAMAGSLSTGSATNLTYCAGASASCFGQSEGTAPTDTTASVDRIYPDSTQQTLELQVHNADFNGAVGVRCTNVTPVTANTSTTADQNLMACALKANTLNNTLRSFRVWDGSLYTTPAASVATINTKVKLCTVSGCGSGTVLTLYTVTSSANPGTVTNNSINNTVWCTVQTAGAAAAFECHGNMVIDLGASPGLADSTFSDNNTATIGTIDTTAALFIQVTRAFSVASGSNSTSERQLVVEILN